jgi:UDP-N-acetylmuramoylalanine-D-glutamate ligase
MDGAEGTNGKTTTSHMEYRTLQTTIEVAEGNAQERTT